MPRVRNVPQKKTEMVNGANIAKNAIYCGVIGGVASYLFLGEVGEVKLGTMSIPSSVGVGIGCAGGSIAGDALSGMVIDRFQEPGRVRQIEEAGIKYGLTALGTVGTLGVLYGIEPSLTAALVGAGSKFAGDGVREQFDPLGMLF